MKKDCFSTVYQCNIAFTVVHVQVCIKSFSFIVFLFMPARIAAYSKRVFVLPVGLYEGNYNCTPNTDNYV